MVLVYAPGLGIVQLEEVLETDVLPETGFLARAGREQHRTRPVRPLAAALTASTEASVLTGAYPDAHGVPANVFRERRDDDLISRSGFDADAVRAESLAEAAARQGRSVLRVDIGDMPLPTALDAEDAVLSVRGVGSARLLTGLRSDLPLIRRIDGDTPYTVQLRRGPLGSGLAVDLRAEQDSLTIELRESSWASARLPGGTELGLWVRPLRSLADDTVSVYVSTLMELDGRPRELVQAVRETLGMPPSRPDFTAVLAGSIPVEVFVEQVTRFSAYVVETTLFAREALDPDLSVVRLSNVDWVAHVALDDTGLGPHVVSAYRSIDNGLTRLATQVGRKSALVVASGYALAPAHTEVLLDRVLPPALARQVEIVPNQSSAFLYVRDPVEADTQLESEIERALRTLRAPESGEPIVDLVATGGELVGERLQDRPSRDLWIRARHGFVFGLSRGESEDVSVRAPRFAGDHGFGPVNANTFGTLIIQGARLEEGSQDTVGVTEIVSMVASHMDISPPRHARERPDSSVGRSGPPLHNQPVMAYDERRRRIVLFGGWTRAGPRGETWESNGETWARIDVSGPSPRGFHGMAFHGGAGEVLMFGGIDADGRVLNDTWTWDGASWTRKALERTPIGRTEFGLAYDSARERVVLFGGRRGRETLGDTWGWDGTTWHSAGSTGPPSRVQPALVYDPALQATILFGGSSITGEPLSDTWIWDGREWREEIGRGPPGRDHHAMAYHAEEGHSVLFGGWNGEFLGDTWVYDVGGWRRQSGPSPSARGGRPAMVYVSHLRAVFMYGGWDRRGALGDVWRWSDGWSADWTR